MTLYNKIVDYAENIYKELGVGYKEHIYVNAMITHLHEDNILYANEVVIPINYNGMQLGYERADIIIYKPEAYILEFKAMNTNITKKDSNQLEKYLKNMNFSNGILLNFGYNKLEVNKILNLNTSETSDILDNSGHY